MGIEEPRRRRKVVPSGPVPKYAPTPVEPSTPSTPQPRPAEPEKVPA